MPKDSHVRDHGCESCGVPHEQQPKQLVGLS